jgi:hypothetical protein
MSEAARRGEILHLWWHPHNCGARPAASLRFLRGLLETFGQLRRTYGMESLGMADVAERCGMESHSTAGARARSCAYR